MRANYWLGQLSCGPPNEKFAWPILQRPHGNDLFIVLRLHHCTNAKYIVTTCKRHNTAVC